LSRDLLDDSVSHPNSAATPGADDGCGAKSRHQAAVTIESLHFSGGGNEPEDPRRVLTDNDGMRPFLLSGFEAGKDET